MISVWRTQQPTIQYINAVQIKNVMQFKHFSEAASRTLIIISVDEISHVYISMFIHVY